MRKTVVLYAHDVGPYGGQELALEAFVVAAAEKHCVHVIAYRVSERVRRHAQVSLVRAVPGPFVVKFMNFWWASSRMQVPVGLAVSCGPISRRSVDCIWMHFWHWEHLRKTRWVNEWEGQLLRWMNQSVSRWTALIVELHAVNRHRPVLMAVSHSLAVSLRKTYPNLTVLELPDPVVAKSDDLSVVRADQQTDVLFVGGEWGRKRLREVGRAADLVGQRIGRKIKLAVVGRGNRHWLNYLGELPFVDLTHYQSIPQEHVHRLMKGTKLVCSASLYETFGMAGHEALANGVRVVTTEVHGLADSVRESGLGLVVGRSVADLARGMEQILNDDNPNIRVAPQPAETVLAAYGPEAFRENCLHVLGRLFAHYESKR